MGERRTLGTKGKGKLMAETLTQQYEELIAALPEGAIDTLLEDNSGVYCQECGCEHQMTDEVFLVRVVQPVVVHGTLHNYDLLEGDGALLHSPIFFCFDCWEQAQEELTEQLEDSPPMLATGGIIECDICHSDVLAGETTGLLELGELHWSRRSPNGAPAVHFETSAEGQHLCLACLTLLEENYGKPLWEKGLKPSAGPEICREGIFSRCWRQNRANCTCRKGV